jgi:UDP:flavonoid glycosyltransferase YjiC (YdhE family)
MRILIIAHIGETFGHLARGLSIAKELSFRGCHIEIASASKGAEVIARSGLQCDFHPIRWDWSHNSCELEGLSSNFLNCILQTTEDLIRIVQQTSPDFILSLPGFASAQIARHSGIAHASVIHGTHLAPLIELEGATDTELYIIEMCKKICTGPLNDAFQVLNRIFSLPWLDYKSFMESERIFIPQPGLPFKKSAGMEITSFARGSIGPPFEGNQSDIEGACYVTFGSGNLCDITRVLLLARQIFPKVIANTGSRELDSLPDGIITRPFIASSSLAGRVSAVISHGGIGTVGTFAEWGVPQLIIPTELDQATMAVHAARAGIAKHVGLESFANRLRLGRKLPDFTDEEFFLAINAMRNRPISAIGFSSGAEEIASSIVDYGKGMTSSVGSSNERSIL